MADLKPKRVAAIDIGTNTFLCLITEGGPNGITKVISDEAEVVRLGQKIDSAGTFHPEALERATKCLDKFQKSIQKHGPLEVAEAAATSAARDANNAATLRELAGRFGISLRVASGLEEARLSYLGTLPQDHTPTRLVVDVGGGSTEFIVGQGKNILFSKSLDIGGVRLTERFVTAQPVPPEDRQALEAYADQQIATLIPVLKQHPIKEIIAVAGTPTAVAALEIGAFIEEKVDGFHLSLAQLEKWREIFATTSVEEKQKKFGLGGRADIIFAGVSILCSTLRQLQAEGFSVSTKGLRYGLALDLLSRA